MITTFCFGLIASFAAGLIGEATWRWLPSVLTGLAVLLGGAVVVGAITLAAQLGVHPAGLGIPALVVGLVLGGNAAHAVISRTTYREP